MFRKFRQKIEQALERKEAQRPLSRDDFDRLLHGMRDELIEIRSRIPKFEKEAAKLSARAEQGVKHAELAYAKVQEAEGAGRADEAHQAMETTRRALSEAEDLRRQSEETRAEAERLKADAAEMMAQLKEAERNRSALLARARRVGTAERLQDLLKGPESGIQRFERAEEEIDTAEDIVAARQEVDEALGDRPSLREIEADVELRKLEAAKEMDEVEERLAELKRRMQHEE